MFDNEMAKLAGGAGNRDHDESPSCLSGVVVTNTLTNF
jgi:hypothetical protein